MAEASLYQVPAYGGRIILKKGVVTGQGHRTHFKVSGPQ